MTRVFLAAGVAALAIAAPASAGPHGGGGGGKAERMASVQRGGGGGGQRFQAVERVQRQSAPRVQRQAFSAPRMQRFAAAERPQRAERQQVRQQRFDRVQMRAERQQARPQRIERAQTRMVERQARPQRIERQQLRANRVERVQNRMAQRQQIRPERVQVQNRMAQRQQVQVNRQVAQQDLRAQRQQMRVDRQMARQDLQAQRQTMRLDRQANMQAVQTLRAANDQVFRTSALQALAPRTRFIAPTQAATYVGAPLATVASAVPLMALPQSVSYLYPDTQDYYYRYGDGYLYQVDRTSNLIASLLPLLGGGYLPGTYLPSAYMSSYVPNYYGLNSFYPASYGFNSGYGYNAGYDYGYNNLCNRYANGVIYQVDCYTGLVQNVIPMYAGGYGVGQILPSAYTTYNVPYQYRSMYYNTSDYGYYYAPGAIYQYDPSSSMITSVAALLSPGFTIGQPMPAGYGMYNVPLAYRSTYYDTPNAWYRYNNGYIYQVDPTTQLVTAIVASLLT